MKWQLFTLQVYIYFHTSTRDYCKLQLFLSALMTVPVGSLDYVSVRVFSQISQPLYNPERRGLTNL